MWLLPLYAARLVENLSDKEKAVIIIIIKPENDVDPNMVVVKPNESDSVENKKDPVPEDISSEIKDFIKKVEKNKN